MMEQTKIRKFNYGNYASGNYGAHSIGIQIGTLTLYFSYDKVVAFQDGTHDLVICENVFSVTTGKHLNWINPDHNIRVKYKDFQQKLNELLKTHKLEVE